MSWENHILSFKNYLLYETGRKPSTVREYLRCLETFKNIVDTVPEHLTASDIEKYVTTMKQSVEKGKTHSNSLTPSFSAVKRFLEYLYDKHDKEIKLKNKRLLSPPKWIDKRIIPLTKDEVRRILQVSQKHPRDYAIIQVLVHSTNRVGEITNLNIDDVIPPSNENKYPRLYVWQEKISEPKVKTIPIECYEAIQNYLRVRMKPRDKGERALFLNEFGVRLSRHAIWQFLQEYSAEAKINRRRLSVHSFRHFGISMMAKNNMTAPQIQTQSGHKSLSSVQKYIHLNCQDTEDKVLESLSMKEETSKPDTIPIPPEKPQPKDKQKPDTADNHISKGNPENTKIRELELLLQIEKEKSLNKERDLELQRLKHRDTENFIYG